jgi:Spy/CpxP family protein refolding chaperone
MVNHLYERIDGSAIPAHDLTHVKRIRPAKRPIYVEAFIAADSGQTGWLRAPVSIRPRREGEALHGYMKEVDMSISNRSRKFAFATVMVRITLVAAAALSVSAFAQRGSGGCPGDGYGPGPGMMGGGFGAGMMGGGYGQGRGMMGGGYGYGGGPGMMGLGVGWVDALGLSDDQKTKINRIQDETRRSHWALMGTMMDQQAKLRDLYEAPKRDSAAIDDTYKSIGDLRQKMIDSSIEARKRMEAVLTSKQIDKLRAYRDQDRWDW